MSMLIANIEVPIGKIEDFCRRNHIREFALFGSVLRDDFHPGSDIDVLVTFADDAKYDLFDFVDMQEELTALFGRNVDMVEKKGLKNPFRRYEILKTKEVVYAA